MAKYPADGGASGEWQCGHILAGAKWLEGVQTPFQGGRGESAFLNHKFASAAKVVGECNLLVNRMAKGSGSWKLQTNFWMGHRDSSCRMVEWGNVVLLLIAPTVESVEIHSVRPKARQR